MIHVRADQVKNIKNVVADNISGYRHPESHLLQRDLYHAEKMGLNFFQVLAGPWRDRDFWQQMDRCTWNAVYSGRTDWNRSMPVSDF